MKISNVRVVGHHGHVEILADVDGESAALRMREPEFDALREAFSSDFKVGHEINGERVEGVPDEPKPDPKRGGSASNASGLSPEQFDRLLAAMRSEMRAQAKAGDDLPGKSTARKSDAKSE